MAHKQSVEDYFCLAGSADRNVNRCMTDKTPFIFWFSLSSVFIDEIFQRKPRDMCRFDPFSVRLINTKPTIVNSNATILLIFREYLRNERYSTCVNYHCQRGNKNILHLEQDEPHKHLFLQLPTDNPSPTPIQVPVTVNDHQYKSQVRASHLRSDGIQNRLSHEQVHGPKMKNKSEDHTW
eukprot:scaffold11440_cov53-Attheya_sp.AAC.2